MDTKPHNSKPLLLLGLSLILFMSLVFSENSWANRADWGLVQRFQSQLEQAQNGKIKAMYEVGRMYERGRGTAKNFDEAANWYQKAADGGSESAKARLGKMYLEGRGIKKDLGKAYRLLSEAARSNVSSAQYQLAIMYEIGIGIDENTDKALYWYKKAAQLGHYQAERKAKKLAREIANSPPAKIRREPQPAKATAKPAAKPKPAASSSLIETIANASWVRRKRPAGYLPSANSNCKKTGNKTLVCISNEQERNTGSEIITYNTEAVITPKSGKTFIIEYTNNVLEVELVENEIISGVEVDEESTSETASKKAIHTGKQETVHHLDCTLNNSKSISCLKNRIRTLQFSS